MMTENFLIVMAFAKLQLVAIFAVLYIVGGRFDKRIRRWIAGPVFSIFCLGFFIFESHNLRSYLSAVPLAFLPLALTIGYGAPDHDILFKLIRRLIYGTAIGSIGLITGIIQGVPWMGVFQLMLAISTSVFFGVRNPVNAVYEETIIAMASVALIPFMVMTP